ncbi:AAA family ATPase [Hyphobacterium sp.]|jgi:chromosomal replication initiation ATPase DnaA|uniref:AAA family ATPase n=1 Tax=Hyphobacterium sp. TaxID=2004662 RepID=UPI003BAA0F81
MGEQLALGLPPREDFSAASFVDGEANAAARWALAGWRAWPGRVLAIYGPPGTGKTHLAHMWAAESGALIVRGSQLEAALDELPADRAIVVEDADRTASRTALFHLLNRAQNETAEALLLTAREAPSRWDADIPDLRSRLLALPTAALDEPDDELLARLLAKLFADRQSPLVDGLIAYLIPRMERSVEGARRLVDALDREALARRTPINRGVARRVLGEQANDEVA